MSSIRRRLFLILLAATGAVWLMAVMWIQHSTRAEVGHVLDRRLEESARMVASLVMRQGDGGLIDPSGGMVRAAALPPAGLHPHERQLSCQIWGLDGRLLSESEGAPGAPLTDTPDGFSDSVIDGQHWRVFSLTVKEGGLRVMVGDAHSMRDRLTGDVILGLVAPALLILPLLAWAIWLAVGRGLRPVESMAQSLSGREARDLSPLPDADAPSELRPMIAALNGLFWRVGQARDREQTFTAFAAHELKTPLAGLKTQAQIAAIAPDEATRSRALAQIATGVTRTDRMVRQLLDMTTVDHATRNASLPQDGAELLAEVAGSLEARAKARGVGLQVDVAAGKRCTTRSPVLLAPALRNLIENAIQASPEGGTVEVGLTCGPDSATFRVADRGPGIAEADRPHVCERFYRGSHRQPGEGSGLGLTIVATAVERMGGTFRLTPREGGGEVAELVVPREQATE